MRHLSADSATSLVSSVLYSQQWNSSVILVTSHSHVNHRRTSLGQQRQRHFRVVISESHFLTESELVHLLASVQFSRDNSSTTFRSKSVRSETKDASAWLHGEFCCHIIAEIDPEPHSNECHNASLECILRSNMNHFWHSERYCFWPFRVLHRTLPHAHKMQNECFHGTTD